MRQKQIQLPVKADYANYSTGFELSDERLHRPPNILVILQ